MDYVDKKDEEQIDKVENAKSKNLIKTIFAEDTIVEDPQDIIDKDTDEDRKNAFKKAYEIIVALLPETITKKKRKKSKEKEEFDRNLAYYRQNELERETKEKEDKEIEEKDKGIERGE